MSLLRNVGKIQPATTTLFLCDMQTKFRPSIKHFDAVVQNSNRVLAAAQHMAGEDLFSDLSLPDLIETPESS